MLTVCRRTRSFLDLVPCCTSLRITKLWLKWSSKAEVQQWNVFSEPTELLLIGCLTELIWTPKSKSSIDTKHQLADVLFEVKFTHDEWNNVLYLFNIRHFSSLCHSQNFSLTSCRKGCKNRKERTGSWQSQSRRRWTWPSLSRQVLRLWTVRLRRKAQDTQSALSNRWVMYRETWGKRSQSRRSVELILKNGRECMCGRKYRETCRTRISRNSRKLRRFGNRKQWRRLAAQSPHFTKPCAAHGEGLLDRETKDMVAVRRIKWQNLDVNTVVWGMFMSVSLQAAVHLAKITRKICDHQESTLEIFETVISSDWQVDHGSDRNYWTDHDWLAAATWWEKPLNLQLPKPKSFLTQCYVWEVSLTNQSKLRKAGFHVFWKHVISKIWIGSMGNRWSSSGKFSQDSLHWEFSTRFKKWWLNQSVNQSNAKEGSSSCQCTMPLIEYSKLFCGCSKSYRCSMTSFVGN